MTERPVVSAPPWPRPLLVLLGTAAAFITIAGLRGASGIIGPVFLSIVLTIAAHPLRGWLVRRRVPGWLATVIMIVTVYAFIVGFALAMLVATARFAALLPQYKEQMTQTVDDLTSWLASLGVSQNQIKDIASSFDVGHLIALFGDLLGGLTSALSSLFFILTLLLFLAIDAAWFPARLAAVSSSRAPLATALAGFAVSTRTYLVVSTVFGLIVAVIDTIALWVMGIPAPLLWGLLAFITNYIPNIGFIIGLLPVAVLGFLQGGVGLMLSVIAVYSLVNVVIQSVIQPKVVGDNIGLTASLTFLSLIFWAWVLGAVGALLAVPLSLLVKALLVDIDPESHWLRPLIGDTKDLPGDG